MPEQIWGVSTTVMIPPEEVGWHYNYGGKRPPCTNCGKPSLGMGWCLDCYLEELHAWPKTGLRFLDIEEEIT